MSDFVTIYEVTDEEKTGRFLEINRQEICYTFNYTGEKGFTTKIYMKNGSVITVYGLESLLDTEVAFAEGIL